MAVLAGTTIEALRNAGSRGKAVHGMLAGLRALALKLFRDGQLQGVVTLGGAEGAVLGASAMMGLPIGVPKVIVTPIASGHRRFGPLVGTKDVMVMHSVIDILGLNPISTTVFDNVAAAMAGMASTGTRLRSRKDRRASASRCSGNTTKAVMMIRDRLARPASSRSSFTRTASVVRRWRNWPPTVCSAGIIDYTTDELTDELVGGFHAAGPNRLRAIGKLGIPQVVVPGCIDFSVHGRPEAVPPKFAGRPVYTHNPEFTLVRTLPDEMRQLGRIFAERLNEATGPVEVMVPTEGLSIPSKPGDVFWNPESDAGFLAEIARRLRPDIPVTTHAAHINDRAFASCGRRRRCPAQDVEEVASTARPVAK